MWITRARFNAMKKSVDEMVAAAEKLQTASILISIERKGRANVFSFMRGKEVHQIETYSTMSDDLPGWKEKLLR